MKHEHVGHQFLATDDVDHGTAEEDIGLRGPAGRRPRLLAMVPAALSVLGLIGCALLLMVSLVAWKLGLS